MIEAFDLAHVGRAPARFDLAKLESMNGHYIHASGDEELVAALESALPYLPGGAVALSKFDDSLRAKLHAAMPGLKERAKTLIELLDGAKFLFAERPLVLDAKAASILDAGGRAHIARMIPRLALLADWNAASIEAAVRGYSSDAAIKLGDAAQPLRAALTGRVASPGIFDVLEVLGREESLARLQDQAG
jgi:glutamyl-tRNA synthetase